MGPFKLSSYGAKIVILYAVQSSIIGLKPGERNDDERLVDGSHQREKDSPKGQVEADLPVQVDLSSFVSVMDDRLGSMIDARDSIMEANFNASIHALKKTVIDLTNDRLSKMEAKFSASNRKLRDEMKKMKNRFAEKKGKNSDPITGQKWRSILGDCARPSGANGWKLLQFRNRTLKMADGVYGEKNWKSYKTGFEDLRFCGKSTKGKCGRIAFWLGLETMHRLTSRGGNWVVALSYHERFGGPIRCVSYERFKIDGEKARYKLHFGGQVSRHGWRNKFDDLLEYSNGRPFSTPDKTDEHDCANIYKAGWWFQNCIGLCPNCQILNEKRYFERLGLLWSKCSHTYMAMKEIK